ncbi:MULTISPECIES: sporulation protein YpjB [Clostridia]|uniref:sporulation protein YpjB n=1 Tax=Clostridia TaxID=186801 RepID=UPI000EA17695|nr:MULTISPECIES: sporulation protein YpjB [Clostridia]NBJ70506.1 hypothetical protein [Roseburia sp. 1XD42-34]RKI76159.1 hypothetical protein D7V87_14230 [Clostridium sp. 1xD42-85]
MNKNRLSFVLTFGVIIGIIIYAIAPKTIQANVHQAAQPVIEQKGQLFPFIWIVLLVGGCIGITLTYVSWRKYRGEKKNKQDKTVD